MDNKLYVGNLPWSINNDSLKEMFTPYGEVTEAVVIMEQGTGRSKGFGFVTFTNEADAQKAIQDLNEKENDGRKMIVNVARPREERPQR